MWLRQAQFVIQMTNTARGVFPAARPAAWHCPDRDRLCSVTLTLQHTDNIVTINGVPARIWRGQTESGIEVHALITRIAVRELDDTAQFAEELYGESAPVSAIYGVFPLRMRL